uniref:Phosphoglycerate mutase-like protein 1 n=1 Tax=Rhizophora mucronata TaxID=61149 RepID=A0A2P2MJH4_RHIMU
MHLFLDFKFLKRMLILFSDMCYFLQGVHPCDKRQNISDYQFLFPAVDFSLVRSHVS